MRVLLLSAYAARSHVYWREALEEMFPEWEWTSLELPPRFFNWRVRGNPLYWALAQRDVLEQEYDLLIATSMVDLATLRGLVPGLAALPSILYFHENQFAYPQSQEAPSSIEAKMVSLYSALACQSLLFNSTYNMDSFLLGCAELLKKLPDRVPSGIVDTLRARSAVLSVPLRRDVFSGISAHWPDDNNDVPAKSLRLLWTGRFEYDKGGEALRNILLQLEGLELDYTLAMVGQTFRQMPPVFENIQREFNDRLVHFGFLDNRQDYLALLVGSDIVLSTALHEFQGLAVLEAVTLGCIPVVPDRLAYKEIYPPQYRYSSAPGEPDLEAKSAAGLLQKWFVALSNCTGGAPDMSDFTQDVLCAQYREHLTTVLQ